MSRKHGPRVGLVISFVSCALFLGAQQKPVNPVQARTLSQDFKSAASAYDSGNYPLAASLLEKLLPQTPGSFEVHELLGLSYAATSQNKKAVEQMQEAVHLQPQSAAARSNLATAFVHLGSVEEAEQEYRKAIDLDPSNYDANRNLAGIYLQSNRVPEAIPVLTQAQRIRPTAYDNGYDLALAYLLTERPNEARALVLDLVREKDSAELHGLLGRIDEKQGQYLEAVKEFSTAAHMEPDEDNLFTWASELLLHRTYVPAVEVFRQATTRYPQSPRLWIGLGMALYSRGEYEESVRSLLIATDLSPKDPRCYLFLSKAYLSSPNQAEDVIGRFRRYAEAQPHNALAQYYYGLSLWKGRRLESQDIDYAAVAALLQKAIYLDSTFADAHLQLGILYTDQHNDTKSLSEYQRTLEIDPNLPDVHFRLGRYYLHAGDKEKAQSEFDRFKALQAQHQTQEDKDRAEVQQFVVLNGNVPAGLP